MISGHWGKKVPRRGLVAYGLAASRRPIASGHVPGARPPAPPPTCDGPSCDCMVPSEHHSTMARLQSNFLSICMAARPPRRSLCCYLVQTVAGCFLCTPAPPTRLSRRRPLYAWMLGCLLFGLVSVACLNAVPTFVRFPKQSSSTPVPCSRLNPCSMAALLRGRAVFVFAA